MFSNYVDRVQMARLVTTWTPNQDQKDQKDQKDESLLPNLNQIPSNEIKFHMLAIMVLEKVSESDDDIEIRMVEHVRVPLPTTVEVSSHYPEPWSHLPILYPNVLQLRMMQQQAFTEPGSVELHSLTHAEVALRFTECLRRNPFVLSAHEETLFANLITLNDKILTPHVNREQATHRLRHSPVGTWLLRESSLQSGSHVQARVISVSMPSVILPSVILPHMDSTELVNDVHHYLIAQIEGFGFVWINTVHSHLRQHGFPNPGISSVPFFIKGMAVFPNFLALLAFVKGELTENHLNYSLFCPFE